MAERESGERRIATTLQQLLAIGVADAREALDEAATLLAAAFGAEKVDLFVYEPGKDTLAAAGTSRTPLGEKQRQLGLDRLPVSLAGLTARAFTSGQTVFTGHADREGELPAIVGELAVRSELLVPLAGRRGVLSTVSTREDAFDDADAALAAAAAGWVALLLDRAELLDRVAAEAERRGRRAAAEELARLTRREQEVVAAAAEGLTNQQIGLRLTLEEGTVANHLARILRKLGLTSRTQLAVWAVERGLYRTDWAEEHDA